MACAYSENAGIFVLSRHEKKGEAMPFKTSVFCALLNPISRRRFAGSVARHGGDAYDKNFSSWDHLTALIFAQLCGADSLRGLEAAWSANRPHHYHLGGGQIVRSTLSDASRRRPAAIFAETFADLAARADRKTRKSGCEMVKLIDSSPIPLNALHEARFWNGRIKGAKLHLVFDPETDTPEAADITPANVNDISFAHEITVRPGASYVFDKGYCSMAFWRRLHEAGATFVTRAKRNAKLELVERRPLTEDDCRETNIVRDEIVRHTNKNTSRITLQFPLRRVTVVRDDGKPMEIISNDLKRPAREIAALYRRRWRIELLFRWLKQHLKIKRFLGRSQNAVKLQILAALITYILLRIAAHSARRCDLRPIRFTELISAALFSRKPISMIDKPLPRQLPIPASLDSHMQLKLL